MGNTASAEAPRKSLKATHRLSKPKIGNHANASLPSSNGFSKSTRRLSNTEVLPLRPEVAPPLPSPLHAPSLVETGPTDAGTGFPGLEPHEYSCKPPLRSDSFPEIPAHHDRRGSTGTTVSHQAGRPAARRAHSMVVGTSDWSSYENLQATSLSRAGSRRSSNYDPASYQSKRLLNLAEEPSYGQGSMTSEGQYSAVGTVGTGYGQPLLSPEAASLPRAKSDVALYTPMRRRSLLITPGTATRMPTPVNATAAKPKPKTRSSLPTTPARRGSPEPTDGDSPTLPFLVENPASIPRALTPSDAEYKQTGAFKLGTLRITNGSPIGSTGDGSVDEDFNVRTQSLVIGTNSSNDYFGSMPLDGWVNIQSASPDYMMGFAGTRRSASSPNTPVYEGGSLPAIQVHPISPSAQAQLPPVNSPRSPFSLRSPQLQVTSKHTAMEDELFEDDPHEFSTEVLDVRVDINAKSISARPSLMSEASISTDLSRADSGIVASPIAEAPPKPLAKADSGYSSNVSLRSFSSRRRARGQVSRSRGNSTGPSTPPEHTVKSEELKSPKAVPEVQDHTSLSPAPMSEKDCRRSTDAMNGVSRFRLLGSLTRKSKTNVSEAFIRDEDSGDAQLPASDSLNINIAARKQKRIQRLFSGARASFSVQVTQTHPSEQTTVPPIPQEVQTKLGRRNGSLSKLMRSDRLKSARSRDTLGTILSVGSAEAPAAGIAPDSQSNPKISEKAPSGEIRGQILGGAEVSNVYGRASFAARRAVARKPVPPPIKSGGVGERANRLPSLTPNQANASATGIKSSIKSARSSVDEPRLATPTGLPSATRSPPPVSMNNRAKGIPLRRPKSTGATHLRNSPQLSHQQSHDKFLPNVAIHHSVSMSSHEKLHSRSFVYHDSKNTLSSPSVHQTTVLRQQAIDYRCQNWNVTNNHNMSESRKSSFDYSRTYSISTRSNGGSAASSRTNSFQDNPQQHNLHLIRHRSSYDGHARSRPANENVLPHSSSIHYMQGNASVNGPWRGPTTASQPRDEPPRNIPYVSRSHIRNRSGGSFDAHGNPLPFRVLHSYNSPAYRNAPIWA